MLFIRKLLSDRAGVTAVEYGLFVALIGLAMSAALGGVGDAFAAMFVTATSAMAG